MTRRAAIIQAIIAMLMDRWCIILQSHPEHVTRQLCLRSRIRNTSLGNWNSDIIVRTICNNFAKPYFHMVALYSMEIEACQELCTLAGTVVVYTFSEISDEHIVQCHVVVSGYTTITRDTLHATGQFNTGRLNH